MSTPVPFDGQRKAGHDLAVEASLSGVLTGTDPLEAVKNFMLYSRPQWLKRFVAHTELFVRTLKVPGDIAELGVFQGAGLFTWAKLLECYCVGSRSKIVYGFENWTGFSEPVKEDGSPTSYVAKEKGGFAPAAGTRERLDELVGIFDGDRYVPWKNRIELVDGNIEDSTRTFIQRNPGVKFSLVHFDCDMYAPTLHGLSALWPRVSRGGIVIFDEYSCHDWAGETNAVDEYFADKKEIVRCIPWANSPAGYIQKL